MAEHGGMINKSQTRKGRDWNEAKEGHTCGKAHTHVKEGIPYDMI